jgi:Tol biopolymer transport system component
MDHARIVFTRFNGDGREMFNDLYAIDPDGKNETRLTMNPGPDGKYMDNAAPRYNRDKTLIACVRFAPGAKSSHILVMDPAGKEQRQLTTDDVLHANPSWSPDGSWLIYCCDLGTPHLRRLNVDTGEIVLYEPPARGSDSSPVWSGNEIVFSSSSDWEEADALANLNRMSDTGENIQRLTSTQAFDYCGDW